MEERETLKRAIQERDRRIAELEAENAGLRREIHNLKGAIEELKRTVEKLIRAKKRQAAPFSKGPPKANPKKPGRKPGAAYGIAARRKRPRHVDEVIQVPAPKHCDRCGGDVRFQGTVQQFQEEIPRKPIVRRFDIGVGRCRNCGRRCQGRHRLQTCDAVGAAQVQMGPDAQAMVALWKDEIGVSYGDVKNILRMGWDIHLSRGGAAHTVLRVGKRLQAPYRGIHIVLKRSRVAYLDETGWKVEGRLRWLWTAVAKTVTLFMVRPSRGQDVIQEMLGLNYSGTVNHDGWAPYEALIRAVHQQCVGHPIRRAQALLETLAARAGRFPEAVLRILRGALALRDRRDAGEISPHGLKVAAGRLQWQLHDLVMARIRNPLILRFAKHLALHLQDWFTFLYHPGLEATSWPADQAMRHLIANRKIFGGNRTWAGARGLERICSVALTCRQRGVDVMKYLSQVLCAPDRRRDQIACGLLALPLPP